ncbi:hypothetical protein [Candidatus Poriferisodalis sp.]|uniref:hypothetical protein n=1 Tax=Candidatus Poriferisodalis sp. TaxID=3101277 RepID=UPI003B010672
MGDKSVDIPILCSLIKAAREERPDVASLEDFLPHDPRLDVRVEWAGEMFRTVAGALERPTADIDTLRRLSTIIDPVLHEHTEYGLIDVVELVLRRVNAVAGALAPAWSSTFEQDFDSPPQISSEEFAAAMSLVPLESQIARCGNPERARAALEAHSVFAKKLRGELRSAVATFGSTIAIRHGQHRFTPLPAGLIVEALDPSAGELTARALALDPSLNEKWRRNAWNLVGDMFVGAGNHLIGPLRDARHRHLHSVIRYSDTQFLAVSVAANLDLEALHETIEDGAHCLDQVMPGSSVRTTTGIETIPDSARLSRLLIVAHPQALMIGGYPEQRCAAISLRDFDWIRSTNGGDQIDLWYFARDCVEPRNVGRIFSPEVIDKWETWKSQGKSFYSGARELGAMYIASENSLLEWQQAAEQRDIELALHALGMGRVSAWPWHSLDGDSKLVGNAEAGVLYRLVVCETPVAVALYASSGAEPSFELAYRLGNCVAYKLECIRDRLVDLMHADGLKSLRIEFAFDGDQQLPLQMTIADNSVLTVGCAQNLQDLLQEDSLYVEEQFGNLLADAISGEAASEEFVRAWGDAPPGIRVDAITVGPQVQQTPEARSLHASHRSARLAELGSHLEGIGIEPRTYDGDDAKRLETDTIYPWLIARLHEELAPFDRVAVLRFALTQLEYTNSQRWWKNERTAYHAWSSDEREERFHESSQGLLNQSRFISLIVEEALARPPSGSRTPTEYEWQELLSLATLAGESSSRSEILHRELAKPALVVTDLYQVTIDEDDIGASVDLGSFSRDHRLAALPDPRPIGSTTEDHDPDQQWAPFGERLPAYAGIEQALQESLGFGFDAILVILDVIIRWPVPAPQCTDLVSPQQLAAEAHTANPEILLADYEAAAAWLSLSAEELASADSTIKHWEVERRWARVAIRPLVGDGSSAWVLPWTAEIARRAWLTYLSQLRMPIPDDDLPPPVAEALRAARGARNLEFESDCLAQLADPPLRSLPRVRKRHAQRHGIVHLSGEIDILSIDSERSLIFVIEAKDPFVPLSARSIHTQITQFHEEGRYVDKLNRKVEDIKASAASLADNKGIERPDREWRVIGVMVTRHVTPAAYMRECPTTFCTIDTLRRTIEGFES